MKPKSIEIMDLERKKVIERLCFNRPENFRLLKCRSAKEYFKKKRDIKILQISVKERDWYEFHRNGKLYKLFY